MTLQAIVLMLQILFASDAQHIDIQKQGNEAIITIDGQEYRMIKPVIGEAWEYNPERIKELANP